MKPSTHLAVALTASLLACTSASAFEPFKLYDNFSAATLDLARWDGAEVIRAIKGGQLNIMQRTLGLDVSDNGLTIFPVVEKLANPTAVTALKAKVTINALETNTCPANPTPSTSAAQIAGSFFNIGEPVPGSRTGDVVAFIQLDRASASPDPIGVLHVVGFASICTNPTCTAASPLGLIDLGTVTVGQATTVQMQWDQPGKRIKFSRDAGAFNGSIAYTQTDASPPGLPLKQLGTTVYVPHCKSGPRVTGMVDASFDSISVNSSAVP